MQSYGAALMCFWCTLLCSGNYRQHGERAGVLDALRQMLRNGRAAMDDTPVPGAPQAQELRGTA